MRLDIISSNQFKKDLKLAKKRGLNLARLRDTVEMLAQLQPLPPGFRDHSLTGNYQGFRECHIQPDWLLIYRVHEDTLQLFLFRTGTHSDLF